MNIFSRIKNIARSIRALSLTEEKSWSPSLWNLIGSQSLSGETVTESTALTYSAVWCAINLISGTIGSLPLHLMQRKGKTKRLADDRVMYGVLHDQWNPYMSAMTGRETMMAHILTWGNGYAEMVRNGYGELIQLWPIGPNRVKVEMENGELIYLVSVPGHGDVKLGRDQILHIPGLGYDGFIGYSPIAMARKSIGLGMAMETFGSRYFGDGTHPSAVVTHPGQLKDVKAVRDAMNSVYSGLGNTHKLMLLEEGMKIEKVGIPPEDSQFLESRQFQIPEIARWFNLPPHKLKDLTRSSFNNIESEQISFVIDSILPWLVRLEQGYNMQLLTPSDREYSGRGRLYYKHSVEGLLRGDVAARGLYYEKMLDRGVFSINEVRSLEDMDPVPGGDIHLVQLNMTSLENAGKSTAPAPANDATPPAIPPGKGNGKDKSKEPLQLTIQRIGGAGHEVVRDNIQGG